MTFPHHVGIAGGRQEIGRTVGDNEVLCRNEMGTDAAHAGIVVNLLEGGTGQGQGEQHLLRFRPELRHLLGQQVVHVLLDTLRLLFLLVRYLANNLGLDGTGGRE